MIPSGFRNTKETSRNPKRRYLGEAGQRGGRSERWCGNRVLSGLLEYPTAPVASHNEVTTMISILMAAAISGIVSAAPAESNTLAATQPYRASGAQQLDDSKGSKHACKGQNACKGQGGCKTDKHGCKGQNACKGQGGCKG